MRRLIRTCGNFLADLFKGPGNHFWDLGRILAFMALSGLMGATVWNIWLKQPIDLGPGGLGGGLAGVLTAAAGFLAAKAWERSKHSQSDKPE